MAAPGAWFRPGRGCAGTARPGGTRIHHHLARSGGDCPRLGRKAKMNPMDTQEKIKQQVTGNPVVLYMKGTPQFPQCGFSALAVQALNACGVSNFFSVNVLENPDIRNGIKEYANWPTIPQLYVNGEFVGGSDIMKEMYQSGELQKLLEGLRQQA